MRGDSSSLGDPQEGGPIWGSGVLATEARDSRAGEHRWRDESFLVIECLRASGGQLPVSLLGEQGLLGDMAVELRAETVSLSTGPDGASPSWGRPRIFWLDVEQLLAVKCSASEATLPLVASWSEVASRG